MKFCEAHWTHMRELVQADEQLASMIADGGIQAAERMITESALGRPTLETYDPLMSMHWGIVNIIMERVGLHLLALDGPEDNEGHWCPICYVNDFCNCNIPLCGEEYIPWAFDHVKNDVANLQAEQN